MDAAEVVKAARGTAAPGWAATTPSILTPQGCLGVWATRKSYRTAQREL